MAHADLVCSRCGNLRSECSDPDRDWHVRDSVCYASATSAWGLRQLEEKHKARPLLGPQLHPLDGVSVYVTSDAPPPEEDPLAS